MVGMAEDRRVDGDLRAALKSLGPDASLEAQGAAAARVLRAHGRGADSESVAAAVSQATAPPRPAPSAAAVQNAVYDIATHIPDEATQADILKHQDDAKPIAAGPPPKGAADAYQKYPDVFEQAQKEYGVAPKHILGILSVETGFGANMGDKPLVSVLLTLETQPKKSAQAASDLRALATLAADGDLGGRTPSQVVSNYAGAYGPPQFLASSQLAYGRSADGAGTDLFKFPNAILSVANYLQKHGYGQDVPHSIFGYNHSQEYVNTVLARSESIAPLIKNAAAAPAPTAPSK
jgi:membrane-bound lytic murein transglycosylase B